MGLGYVTDGTYTYGKAAVATDTEPCSTVGLRVLRDRNGSAVDAAIATLLCIGVVSPHSSGIGGGAFFLIYSNRYKTAEVIDAREVAPRAATTNMYSKNPTSSLVGGLAVAVPGELKGMEVAHQKYGILPWKVLFQDAISFATNGVRVSRDMSHAIQISKEEISDDPGMTDLLSHDNGRLLTENDVVSNLPLSQTLATIASQGTGPFYCGSLTDALVKDIRARGGIITRDDLCRYQVNHVKPLVSDYRSHQVLGVPPPAGGAVLAQMLNILDGFSEDNATRFSTGYHQLVEAAKFAYSQRLRLGDPSYFNRVYKILSDMLNKTIADKIRSRISPDQTYKRAHYRAKKYSKPDHGTSHVSILAPNGDAVAVTSTINYYFGAKMRSPTTGILLNNQMDDFSTPGLSNIYGLAPAPSNFIHSGKRPQSSMSPTIILDAKGKVKLVIGASGGSRITTGVAQVVRDILGYKDSVGCAVHRPRCHHQMLPNNVFVEPSFPLQGYLALIQRAHRVEMTSFASAVQAIVQNEDGTISAASDRRKGGKPNGF